MIIPIHTKICNGDDKTNHSTQWDDPQIIKSAEEAAPLGRAILKSLASFVQVAHNNWRRGPRARSCSDCAGPQNAPSKNSRG